MILLKLRIGGIVNCSAREEGVCCMKSRIYKPLENEEIQRIIKNVYDNDTIIEKCQRLDGGLFNTTYLIHLTRPEQKLVLRIAPIRQELLFSFEQRMMSSEPMLYHVLNNNGIPAPKVIKHDCSFSVIGREYLLTEYIDGTVPLNHSVFPASERKKIQHELGIYTSRIHEIKGNQFGWPNPNGTITGSENWADVLLGFVREIANRVSNYHVFDDHDIKVLEDIFHSNRSLFKISEQPSLVHNDLWDANILVKEKEGQWSIAAIIDADRSMYADPEYEFILWENNPSFIRGYGREINASKEAVFRRKAYHLAQTFFNTYVFKIQLDNEEKHEKLKSQAINLLKELSSFV
jgi:aminoglycoside phosphotransferase (APT) family kinase protein